MVPKQVPANVMVRLAVVTVEITSPKKVFCAIKAVNRCKSALQSVHPPLDSGQAATTSDGVLSAIAATVRPIIRINLMWDRARAATRPFNKSRAKPRLLHQTKFTYAFESNDPDA
ncbi:hypothetical protein C7374_102183 [Falsochrobactrum ovis]|uniref:Uncharacterized protein n=1 Tax=Falsochrobactrum ovis TaxID=1293442 RepID=A0A364JXL2_9HYPH|nr:hypothetical protein C7374_102183 [Falsochrobactrum ovis]